MEKRPLKQSGRPKLPDTERLSERFVVMLTPTLYAKLLRIGGVNWIREKIRTARE